MLLPLAVAYSFITVTFEANAETVRTNADADLACNPSLFLIVTVLFITEIDHFLLRDCRFAVLHSLGEYCRPAVFYLDFTQFSMPNLYIFPG